MALINITPVMTANNAPAPYIASSSGDFDTGYQAFRAFNNTNSNGDCWATPNGTTAGWVKLDLSVQTKVDAITIFQRNYNNLTEGIKECILYGSNDNINYEQIIQITNQISWAQGESRLFKFPYQANFRYYRLNIISNNGNASYSSIGDIKFWREETTTQQVSNQNAYQTRLLPKTTFAKAMSKANDPNEGNLGYANDNGHYGTLLMVDNTGKSIIPKAKFKQDILFDGKMATAGTYTLNSDITKYRYLIIQYGLTAPNENGFNTSMIPVTDITSMNLGSTSKFMITESSNSANVWHNYYIVYSFLTANQLTIQSIGVTSPSWTQAAIYKVFGVY